MLVKEQGKISLQKRTKNNRDYKKWFCLTDNCWSRCPWRRFCVVFRKHHRDVIIVSQNALCI